ncbi:hypothetical protein HZC20_02130 [Candidatus Peregrinibacteria bacterium]|nr:hypothetical protein [Candidatus Peregrinibacteria bacterium]
MANTTFISLDLETNGIDSSKNKIIEFGAVKFDFKNKENPITEKLNFFVNPGAPLPQIITHITGIKDADLENAESIESKIKEIENFIGDLPIVGHNIQFDISFLKTNGIKTGGKFYDTFVLSSIVLPNLPSYSLEILSAELNLQHKEKHRALDDSIAAMELFIKLAEKFQTLEKEIFEKIHSLLERTNWPLKDFLLGLKHAKTARPKKKKLELQIPKPEKSRRIKALKNQIALPLFEETTNPEINLEQLNIILENKKNLLVEIDPYYKQIIKYLSKKIDAASYISISSRLFREIEKEIPDNFAKLESPKKYVSIKRLKEFSEKHFFEDYEISALIKYLVWIKATKTGLLDEVFLLNEEKSTFQFININDEIDPTQELFFKKALEKDKNNPSICSHSYIIENKSEIKGDLIILDIDHFIKNLHYENSLHLSLNHLPKTDEISMTMGLIGIIFEKYKDENEYTNRSTITEEIISSRDWQNAKNSIEKLTHRLSESEEKNDQLKILQDFFSKQPEGLLASSVSEANSAPETDTHISFIEQDQNKNMYIVKAPTSIKSAFEKIYKNCGSIKILSECLNINDNGNFIKNLLGIPRDTEVKKLALESDKNKLEIKTIQNIPRELTQNLERKEYEKTALLNILKTFIDDKKGHMAITLNSHQQLEYFTLNLQEIFKDSETKIISQMTGSLNKVTEQLKQNPENGVLLITPKSWEKFNRYDLIDTLIITKIPFYPPSETFICALEQGYQNPFMELQIPLAIIALKRMMNSLKITAQNIQGKGVIILDPRLITKDYGKIFLGNI